MADQEDSSISAPSLAAMAEKCLFEKLSDQIRSATEQSVFAIGGSVPIVSPAEGAICEADEVFTNANHMATDEQAVDHNAFQHAMRCDPITIRWDSPISFSPGPTVRPPTDAPTLMNAGGTDGHCHKLILPCSEESRFDFDQLLKDCQPASFGRGGVDIMDELYRKAGKLDESAFCTNFNPYSLGIIDLVAQILAPGHSDKTNVSHGLRAELYKLNVYAAPSGIFKSHVDTPRSKSQIGSLVVCLPSVHEGGQLALRHQGKEMVLDWSGEKGSSMIQWAAFYSDCEHEVLQVTSGHRITLTYNLYTTCWVNTVWPDPEQLELYEDLRAMLREPAFCKEGLILGYHCAHAYPHNSSSAIDTMPTMLKGVDKVVYESFLATLLPTRLKQALDFNLTHDHDIGKLCLNDDFSKRKDSEFGSDDEMSDTAENPWQALEATWECETVEYNGGDFKLKAWVQKPESQRAKEDLYILSDGLVRWQLTERGMQEEPTGYSGIIEKWTKQFKVRPVKWLNQKSHKEMALIHGTYGNQAGIGTMYCSMVITLEVPPFRDRQEA